MEPPSTPASAEARDHAAQEGSPNSYDRRLLEAGATWGDMCSIELLGVGIVDEVGRGAGRVLIMRQANAQKRCILQFFFVCVMFTTDLATISSSGVCRSAANPGARGAQYPRSPPTRPMAAAVANDMEATLRAAGVRPAQL